jgi:hypothetical protein
MRICPPVFVPADEKHREKTSVSLREKEAPEESALPFSILPMTAGRAFCPRFATTIQGGNIPSVFL